ncbi:Receptor-transporting protein 3 [Escovopsis weberi]|uniref:Receptor-transporting protein 3 n=1 Tax=Escovopsis weberi TaxID=150374 RepID=A0A0M9VSW5_ESCWE|nr:Receptor-transporting protein 3 [Escovopsis weberi]
MKYSAAILALVAAASAQSLSDLPSCAKKCLDDSIAKVTKCTTDDLPCVCKNFDDIEGDALSCVVEACGAAVALSEVQPAAQKLCASIGGDAPSASAPSSSAAAAPPTSAAAPPTSSAAPPTSSAAPPTSAAAPPTSSAAPPTSAPASSAPASSTAADSSSTTLKSVPTGTGNLNGTVPTSSPHVGGAAGLTSVGGLVMLALGALAL